MKATIVGLFTVAAIGGVVVAPVEADPIVPIVVTSGSWSFPANTLTFMADGLSLTGQFPDFVSIDFMTCDPCSSALNQPVSFSQNLPFVASGSGTFNGVSYPAAYVDGDMEISVSPVFAGALSPDHTTLTAPFTMTGTLAGFPTAAERQANLNVGLTTGAFVNDPPGTVTGSGTVTATFRVDPVLPLGSNFDPTSITYQFQSTPPVTPEPTTVLLLGTGVGLIWRRVRA